MGWFGLSRLQYGVLVLVSMGFLVNAYTTKPLALQQAKALAKVGLYLRHQQIEIQKLQFPFKLEFGS